MVKIVSLNLCSPYRVFTVSFVQARGIHLPGRCLPYNIVAILF